MYPFARWRKVRPELSELCLSAPHSEDKAQKGQPKLSHPGTEASPCSPHTDISDISWTRTSGGGRWGVGGGGGEEQRGPAQE